ncbi:transposase [Dyadobacter sp. LHD-138]|uniref:transposase n=1 Tax=Dyadobacter sp. LHD-138 TaxID=3071413 RepID=UPI0027E00685|nr:transposase [Dyadobacter sp. LHD-138]MDQ6480701.1 transposase [Dyadobacter sp. LHD-138]
MYIIDSFPVDVCKNIGICRSKIIKGKEFRGYNASKREYFYGFKTAAAAVHVVTTKEGIPVEFMVTAGSIHDNTAFQGMSLGLPENSDLYADSAYLKEDQRGIAFGI